MLNQSLEQPLLCQDEVKFASVWARVMGENQSPIVVGSYEKHCAKDIPPQSIHKTEIPTTIHALSTSLTHINAQEKTAFYHEQPPKKDPFIPCLGETKGKELLSQGILNTLDSLNDFSKLEKQLPKSLKPEIQSLCNQRKKQLNQLETAYFLLTGIDFLRNTPETLEYIHPKPTPAEQRLRYRFRDAQIWQNIYQKSAFTTEDSCLTTLFLQLEQELKEETTKIYHLVESLFWLRHSDSPCIIKEYSQK